MRIRFALLFSLLLFAAPPACAQLAPDIDSLARAFKAEHAVPGLVVAVTGPDGQRAQAYGVASHEDRSRLTTETRFEIGSVTKVFTALLLAEAAERDAVALGDSLGTLLSDSVSASVYADSVGARHAIRLHHLATHTSGLPRLPTNFAPASMSDPYVDYAPADLYAFLDGYDLPRAPGAEYAYSNLGAGLLGHLLARRAGTSYAALLRQRVLAPLGLGETYVPPVSDSSDARLARGYAASGQPASYWLFDALAGAGALRSTAGDVLRFLEAQLTPEDTPLADAIRRTHGVRRELDPRMSVALGWHVLSLPGVGEPLYWHNGGTGGFKSFAGFWPQTGRGFVVLSNRVTPGQSLDQFALALARRLRDD